MDFRRYIRDNLEPLPAGQDADIVEEPAQHLEDIYHEGRRAGLDELIAVARAIDALPAAAGGLGRSLETARRTAPARVADRVRVALDEPVRPAGGRFTVLTDLRRDLRYALRAMFREPGFTAVVVITLALGIGATSAIFSAVDAVLLKSAPVDDPDRLVSVHTVWAARATTSPGGGDQLSTASYLDYVDLRDSSVLAALATFARISLIIDADGIAERIDGEVVSGNYFDVLGVRPVVGRARGVACQ